MRGLLIAGIMLAAVPAYARTVFVIVPPPDPLAQGPSPSTLFQLREELRQQQAADERRRSEEGTTVVNPSRATCAGHPEWIVCQNR
jgi:hypothetical protein